MSSNPGSLIPHLNPSERESRTHVGELARTVRVLAIIEGDKVSGPAKNVLEFCRIARTTDSGPSVQISIATFQRLSKGSAAVAGEKTELVMAARQNGVPIFVIPERFPFDVRVIAGLNDLARQLGPDLIETHAVKSHVVTSISGVGKKIPWIAFHHGYTQTDAKLRFYNSLDRWALRAPAQIVTVSRASQQQLAERGIRKSNIIAFHNAVNPSSPWKRVLGPELNRKKIELGISPDDRVVLCIGRLSREKAQADLISALSHLQRMKPQVPVQVIFLGEGPERARIEQAARSAGLQDRVRLLGYCSHVHRYYEVADVVAIPSTSEASPNVLLEAMAACVPVVATSVGGIPEMVTHEETALLVEPRSPAAMAHALHRLLHNDELSRTLVQRARKLIEKRFSPEGRAQFLTDLYFRIYQLKRRAA